MSNTLKLSDSHVEGGLTANPQFKKYEDKLRQMKDQDGEVNIAELCQVLDEASTIEKHRKLLKGACYVLVVFSLLTIAAIVGLTYAVVDLTKDSQVSSSSHILVTKDSAAHHVATGRALLFDDASKLFNKELKELSDLEFLILPGGRAGAGTVVHVAQVELDPNTSAKVTTTAGNVYEIDATGIHQVNRTSGGRRKLLQSNGGATAVCSSTGSNTVTSSGGGGGTADPNPDSGVVTGLTAPVPPSPVPQPALSDTGVAGGKGGAGTVSGSGGNGGDGTVPSPATGVVTGTGGNGGVGTTAPNPATGVVTGSGGFGGDGAIASPSPATSAVAGGKGGVGTTPSNDP